MLKKILKSYDYSLIITYAILCLFGVIMVYSASMVTAVERYGYSSNYFFIRQFIFAILSFIAFAFTAFLPYKMLKQSKILLGIVIVGLVSLLYIDFFGHVAGHAQSWISIGPLRIQPSEFVKLAVIIYMSAIYTKKSQYINQLNKGTLPPIIVLIVYCFIVATQPDFGTAAIIFAIGLIIVLCSGMRMKTIMKLAAICFILILVLSPFLLLKKDSLFSKVQIARVTSFTDPFKVQAEGGLQLVNSYYAIGSGGLKGSGLGNSVEKLGYLPEPQTDFIMAVISEELGVFGVVLVIGGIAYLVLRGIYIAIKCEDGFGSLLAIGISSMLFIQTFINLGGVIGIIPITGVPLPFISYGGSSLLMLSLSLGILVNISMFNKYEKKYKNEKANKDQTVNKGPYLYSSR